MSPLDFRVEAAAKAIRETYSMSGVEALRVARAALAAADAVQDAFHVGPPYSEGWDGRDAVQDRRRGVDMRPTLEDEANAAWAEVNKARARAEAAEARVGELTREKEHVEALWRSAEAQAVEVGTALTDAIRDLKVANGNRHRVEARCGELTAALRKVQDLLDADPDGDRASDALWVVEQALSAAGEAKP